MYYKLFCLIYRPGIRLFCLWLLLLHPLTRAANVENQTIDSDFTNLPLPAADAVRSYGDDPLQFGELRLPRGARPYPVIILLHGGCWLGKYDFGYIRWLAAAFAEHGIATWNLEYRRVGNPGGGWPGTFNDVAEGSAYLHELARDYPLDMDRVIVAGHSAGGHLALWLANMPVAMKPTNPLPRLKGVLALAPAPDLEFLHGEKVCGHVIDGLMGGAPEQFPDRYAAGSVINRVPLGLPQHIIIGKYDAEWGPVGKRYYAAAKAAGDDVTKIIEPESGHFNLVDPRTTSWALMLASARLLLQGNNGKQDQE